VGNEQRGATHAAKGTVDGGARISLVVIVCLEEMLALRDFELVLGISTICHKGRAAGLAAVVAMAYDGGRRCAVELVLDSTAEAGAFD
jgi:hypothetical protein